MFILLIALLASVAQAAEIEGVPFIPQAAGTCGPAALASVLAYYDVPIDQRIIATATYTPALKGALITDLENYARSQGFQTELKQGTLVAIKESIDRKHPVIVLVDLGFWVISKPHYLVITGYDEKGIRAHTGYEASRFYAYRKFEQIWARKGSTYLIVSPS